MDIVIYSTAYNEKMNVEMRYSVDNKIHMVSGPEFIADVFNSRYGIAVCGTHGKTTTSALLGVVLQKAAADPSAIVGGRVIEWGTNALVGKGEIFVIEADEFQNKFRLYYPKGVILTSVDYDHPDYYKTFEEYKQVFRDFVKKIPKAGFLIAWGDSSYTLDVLKSASCRVMTYGFGQDCEYTISNFQFPIPNKIPNSNDQILKQYQSFNILYKGKDLGNFKIILVGKHNVLNAAAVIAACHRLNIDMEKVREALESFLGTSRRFEYKGKRNGAILIDDYGHHPEEIKATLLAARDLYPEKNIIAVFHPHTYSRTEALLHEFAQSFDAVDKVLVMDIYTSAREIAGAVCAQDLVNLVNKYHRGKAEHVPTIEKVLEYLRDVIGKDDIVISIGAGNVWEVVEKLARMS